MKSDPEFRRLKRKIHRLEQESLHLKETEQALGESRQRLLALLDNIPDMAWLKDADIRFVAVNKPFGIACGKTPKDIIGKTNRELWPSELAEKFQQTDIRVMRLREQAVFEQQLIDPDLGPRWIETITTPILDKKGEVIGTAGVARDITDNKEAERSLRKAHSVLGEKVQERTAELEIKTNMLEEANTALRVLLRKGEEDKTAVEAKILASIEELVSPFLDRLMNSGLTKKQKAYLEIVETNLQHIVTPLVHRLPLRYMKLTPAEIQVANLVKQGKANKEIAELLNLSPRTIETYRSHIRKKVGIQNKKINLRTYLRSVQ